MSFKMSSKSYGEVSVIRGSDDTLVLLYGDRFDDGFRWYALSEREGYTTVTQFFVNDYASRLIHDEHVDRARALRDKLDKDMSDLDSLDLGL